MTKEKKPVSARIEENTRYLKEALAVDKSFDVIQLDLEYAERKWQCF